MLTEKIKNIPPKPGVYIYYDRQKTVLYVGKAKNLRNRVRSYFQKSRTLDPRLSLMVNKIADLQFIVTDTEVEALILEANLIKDKKPRYNVDLRDDKTFPYIRITAEDFPQVFATRKVVRDGSIYFGPYTNVKDMRDALTTLKGIFTIRSCKYDLNQTIVANKKVSLCLDYYIQKCKGPCQQLQSRESYNAMILRVKEFLQGRTSRLREELLQEMKEFASHQEYEEAAKIRDKIEALEKYRNAQKVVMPDMRDRDIFATISEEDDACAVIFKIREGKVINRVHYYLSSVMHKSSAEILEHFLNQYYTRTDEIPREIYLMEALEQKNNIEQWLGSRVHHPVKIVVPKAGEKKKLIDMCLTNARYLLEELKLQKLKNKDYLPQIIKSLQRDLSLPKPPRHIECFDISNIQGSDPVASMVCFKNGRPHKSEYRKFRIKSKSTPDDFAMMREVIHRRYSRLLKDKKDLPDLIIVDGGKGQLSSALAVLKELSLDSQPVIGLAKKLEEIFIPGHPEAQMLPRTSASLRLLQKIRDEAHRFAVTFHRQQRKKRTLTSTLDKIPGIGGKRRNELLKIFGSVKNIMEADIAVLVNKGKLPESIARNVYHYFHPGASDSETE